MPYGEELKTIVEDSLDGVQVPLVGDLMKGIVPGTLCLPLMDPLEEFCTVDACTFVCMGMCASSFDVTLLHISNILEVNIGPAAGPCATGRHTGSGHHRSTLLVRFWFFAVPFSHRSPPEAICTFR